MKKLLYSIFLYRAIFYGSFACAQVKGFTPATAAKQLKLETRFDSLLSKKHIGQTIKEYSAKPHHLGSVQGKIVAESIRKRFEDYGWNVKIETFQVLFPTPKTRVLELVYPAKFTALLKEPAFPEDSTSGQEGQLPTYNAWGADGDVTGELVFVNFGLPEDYEQLKRYGIDVKGKIVIARYGRSWRGIKPKIASEHGAIGCIIYSDPKEDGYFQGEVYPKGPFKNEYTVQRGSVMDMVVYPGDPLTPGVGASTKAKRLNRNEAPTILKIPVLPVSYHDALPLLSALGGPVAPPEWRGALPITYRVGPGTAKVHLKVECDWNIVPAYDVIAKIKGSEYPDEWIIRGNHHDAWVNGADDPVSGLAALLEEAKAIGALHKAGFKPRRTLVYCAWDGEEQSLLGSTEWVEQHSAELEKKAVAYINSDGNSRGFLSAGGSHTLEYFVDEIARKVNDPQTGLSIYERLKAKNIISAATAKSRKELLKKDTLSLAALGTGSDYSAFLQHLGIPSLNLGFGGEGEGGDYHSIYDSYDDYVRFKDSDFSYGVALSETAGRAVLRLANADVMPFDFRSLQQKIAAYVKEVNGLADQFRENYSLENTLIERRYYEVAGDPKEKLIPPPLKPVVPELNFKSLVIALDSLKLSADALQNKADVVLDKPAEAEKLNKLLIQAEKYLLNPAGLPQRTWYKHTIYAPGFYTGYGVKTLPGIRESIEQGQWDEARRQIKVASDAILNLSRALKI